MTTIVNNPPQSGDSGGGMGMIIGLVVLVVLGILFFVYGLPAIRQMQLGGTEVKVEVPSEIDVNVKKTE